MSFHNLTQQQHSTRSTREKTGNVFQFIYTLSLSLTHFISSSTSATIQNMSNLSACARTLRSFINQTE